ncbi:hypothetical protein FDECE_8537 [Fusarium decemcellulare]|nr:hypothetical protein FDECE_8537 [Fusarium decemcellulare]
MANVVTIDNKRYLVDVGYGADGPSAPVLLFSGEIQSGLPDQQLKLEHKTLPQHHDQSQKVWVYAQKRGSEDWADVYHFPDVEFFAPDFDVLNHHAMTQSLWSRTVVSQKFVSDDDGLSLSGTLLLVRDELKAGNSSAQHMRLVKKLESEEQRISALEEYFSISLSKEEQEAIIGRVTELNAPN